MSENETQKAIREAMQKAAAEITQSQEGLEDILGALRLLQEAAGRNLFGKMLDDEGNVLIATQIPVVEKYTPGNMILRIEPRGELFTNVPKFPKRHDENEQSDMAALVRYHDRYGTSDDQRERLEKLGDATHLKNYAKQVRKAELQEEDAELSPKDMAEALADLAKRAAFMFPAIDIKKFDRNSPAQQAMIKGLREAKKENTLALDAAKPLLQGLRLMKRLSKGGFDFDYRRMENSSAIEIRTNPGKAPPQVQFRITAAGMLASSDGILDYDENKQRDITKPAMVASILDARAFVAVQRGEIPLAADKTTMGDILLSAALGKEGGTSKETPAQKAVRDGVRRAAESIACNKLAAEEVHNGLALVKEALQDQFNYRSAAGADHSNISISINPDGPTPYDVVVSTSGAILNTRKPEETYDAWNDGDVARLMADITAEAMIQGARRNISRKPGPL